MLKYLKIAFRNVTKNKRKSLFVIITITIGTIIMIILSSFLNGAKENGNNNMLAIMSGHINVYGVEHKEGRYSFILPEDYVETIREIIKQKIPFAKVINRTYLLGKMSNPNSKTTGSLSSLLTGIDPDDEKYLKAVTTQVKGDLFDILKKPNYCLITETAAKNFEFEVGDFLSFEGLVYSEEYGFVSNSIDMIVGGIIRTPAEKTYSQEFIYTNKKTMRKISLYKEKQTSWFMIYLDNKADSHKYFEILKNTLEKKYDISISSNINDAFSLEEKKKEKKIKLCVNTYKEETQHFEQIITTFEGLSFVLSFTLMIVILMGIVNTLFMAVRERTNEIGTLRAIGMKRSAILLQFILEGIILAILGVIIGVIIGGLIALYFTFNGIYMGGPSDATVFMINNSIHLKITWEIIIKMILIILITSVIASFFPAFKAARLKPVTAIHKN